MKETKDIKAESRPDVESSTKITITKEVGERLMELVARVNEGFEAGRVHRQDIASWIIGRYLSSVTEAEVHDIRISHYDDEAMFESLYRRAKETGEVPDFLREALKKHFHRPETARKNKKSLGKGYISDVPLRDEEAS